MTRLRTSLEARIDAASHAVLDRLPSTGWRGWLVECLAFGLKQGWACLFGGLMLGLIAGTALFYPADAALARYDFLFLGALAIQMGMLAFRLETWDEAKVILVFHVVGTVMEIFKTHVGSWVYPEENVLRIMGVALRFDCRRLYRLHQPCSIAWAPHHRRVNACVICEDCAKSLCYGENRTRLQAGP